MTIEEFNAIVSELQDTAKIGNDRTLRRHFYEIFDSLYIFLETQSWQRETLIEHGEPHSGAYFQNVAEGYYRLGFYETPFYHFSKLVYDLWYQKVLSFQVEHDERIHKGTQVHQIGIILDLLSDRSSAWDYYLAGLTEDLVSKRSIESSQAFRMLRVLGMPRGELENFRSSILDAGVILDPLFFIAEIRNRNILSTYDENKSIDYNKLKQAEILWKGILEKEEKRQIW